MNFCLFSGVKITRSPWARGPDLGGWAISRASSSTLGQKNRKIGNISLENRNKIGIYE